jgi:drug/metabolite transporter (DMT)-like permease
MTPYLTPRHPSPFVLAYGQMTAAALLLVPALLVAGRQPIELDSSVVWSIVALGPIGTGIAYVLNYAIVAREGATVASTVTYLLPVVAVALGALVLDEPITAAMSAGALVVLVGVALSRRRVPVRAHSAL